MTSLSLCVSLSVSLDVSLSLSVSLYVCLSSLSLALSEPSSLICDICHVVTPQLSVPFYEFADLCFVDGFSLSSLQSTDFSRPLKSSLSPHPSCVSCVSPVFPLQGVRKFSICNHLRSYEYYEESILNPTGFAGYPCSDKEAFDSVSVFTAFRVSRYPPRKTCCRSPGGVRERGVRYPDNGVSVLHLKMTQGWL